MRSKIKIQTKIYLNSLGKFLDISSLKKVNKNHAELIADYLQRFWEPDIFRDLFKDLADIKFVVKSVIKNMEIIYKGIIKSGNKDVDSLKEIVLNLNMLVNKYHLNEADRDRIFDLMNEFNKALNYKLKGNPDLKSFIYGGSTILLAPLTYASYKALGGRKNEDILTNTTKNLQKNIKFIEHVRHMKG